MGGDTGSVPEVASVEAALADPGAKPAPETPLAPVAAASPPDPVPNGPKEAAAAEPVQSPQAAATGGVPVPDVTIVEAAVPDPGPKPALETPEQVAAASMPGPVHNDTKEGVSSESSAAPQAASTGGNSISVPDVAVVEAAMPDAGPKPPPETREQVAAASMPDPVQNDAKEAVSAEPGTATQAAAAREDSASVPDAAIVVAALPDAGAALPPETPSAQAPDASPAEPVQNDAKEEVSSLELFDECLVPDICIDHFLYAVYERTLKFDTIKVPERTRVAVTKKGKTRIVNGSRLQTEALSCSLRDGGGWAFARHNERIPR
jgi:hypothetical protein